MKKKAIPKNSPNKLDLNNNSVAAQKARILEKLILVGASGLTTIQIRDDLNCLHPCGRVMELRQDGYVIRTIWTTSADHQGRKHRVGRYVLISQQGRVA